MHLGPWLYGRKVTEWRETTAPREEICIWGRGYAEEK